MTFEPPAAELLQRNGSNRGSRQVRLIYNVGEGTGKLLMMTNPVTNADG